MSAPLGCLAISQQPEPPRRKTRAAKSLSHYLAIQHRGKRRFGRVEFGRSYVNVSGKVFNPALPPEGCPRRGKIKQLSERSRRRLGEVIGEACHAWAVEGHGVSMLTLTYHQAPRSMKVVKSDFNRFMVSWRRFARGPYVAWLEFQGRGDAHFHMIVPGCISSVTLTTLWGRATGQLDDEHFVRHGCKASFKQGDPDYVAQLAATYARKYGAKLDQKTVPECYREWVGRFWFASRCVRDNVAVILVPYAAIRWWRRIAGRSRSWIGPRLAVRQSRDVARFLLTIRQHGFTVAPLFPGQVPDAVWEAASAL